MPVNVLWTLKSTTYKTINNILENSLDKIPFEQEKEQDLPEHNNIREKHYFN